MGSKYMEYKPGTKHPPLNPEIADTPDAFDSCGYIIQSNEVVIDVDGLEKKSLLKLIEMFDIKTHTVWTSRGVHFYFRKPREFTKAVQGVSPLGFSYEMKTDKNQKSITVKLNGVMREIENENIRQDLPWFFYDRKRYPADLTGMSEGDGRNNALFVHRAKLGNRAELRKIINFINDNVFADPLSMDEVENIINRDVSDQKQALSREATELIIKEYRPVAWLGQIYWYNGKRYVTDDGKLQQMILMKYPEQETRFSQEVMKQVEILCDKPGDEPLVIKLNNGILTNGDFYELKNYPEFTPYHIDIDYDENAEPVEIVDEYLNNVSEHDEDYKAMFLEAMAYPLVTDPELIRSIGKFFFFKGNGANGKGTMLQIMQKIFGSENCTNMSPRELADERYLVTVVGKLANLGDDIEPEAINNKTMKVLKNISTADTFSMRKLREQAFSGTTIVKLFFTTNSTIKTFEKGYAFKRRVVWLPMFNKVEKIDPLFITKITSKEALKYWMRLLVEAYRRLVKNTKFTESEKIKQFTEEYHKENNYMIGYIESLDIETDILGHTGPEVREGWNEYNDDPQRNYSPKLLNDALEEMGIVQWVVKDPVTKKSKRLYVRQK